MNWTISQIDQSFVNGVLIPTTAHWQCEYSDGTHVTRVYGTASLLGLDDLSADAVFAHIWSNEVNKDASEQACILQIAQQKTEAHVLRLKQMVLTKTPLTSLEQSKSDAEKLIDEHHEMLVSNLVGNPTQTEQHTWGVKLDTATAVIAGTEPSVAGKEFLKSANIITTEEQSDWAKVVLYKAGLYAHVVGVGERLRSDARKKIHEAETVEQVNLLMDESIKLAQEAVQNCFSK